MSTHNYLEYARLNHLSILLDAQREVASGQPAADAFFAIGAAWRVLGICALLEEADRAAFAACLVKSGQARRALLQRVQQGLVCPPKVICTSKDVFFAASLAAGDIGTARDIAGLAPQKHFEGFEYEDDFLFYHFLHHVLAAPDDTVGLRVILKRWDEVLEGGESAYRDICRELVMGDVRAFESAFMAFVRERQESLRDYARGFAANKELLATEGKVFIEGLAVLRLAELRSLPTPPQAPLIPRLARLPLRDRLPPPDAWLAPPGE
jgi:hypothetical protein